MPVCNSIQSTNSAFGEAMQFIGSNMGMGSGVVKRPGVKPWFVITRLWNLLVFRVCQLHVTRTTYSSSAKYSLFFVMEQPRSRQTRPSVVAPSFSSVFRACSFCPLACHFMTARYSPTSGFTSVFQTWRRGTAKSKKWTPEPYKELFQELSW